MTSYPVLDLTPDELLTTTRTVRKRLDLTRPVPLDLVKECLQIALQAPSGSNRQGWQWMVVTDPALRAAVGQIYKEVTDEFVVPTVVKGAEPISEGDSVAVEIPSLGNKAFTGKVTEISWVSNDMSVANPSYYTVEITVPNPDLELKPGFKAVVRFGGSR